jgi:hypothetical protein
VDRLEFSSLQTAETKVYITKVIGQTTLTDPSGPGASVGPLVDSFVTAAPGETDFTLTRTPDYPDSVWMAIEGVMYEKDTHFTLTGDVVTWNDVAFVIPAGTRVNVAYT